MWELRATVSYKNDELFFYYKLCVLNFTACDYKDDFLKSVYNTSYSFLRLFSTKSSIPSQLFLSNAFHKSLLQH